MGKKDDTITKIVDAIKNSGHDRKDSNHNTQ